MAIDNIRVSDSVSMYREFINDKRVVVHLVCAFRYGREVSTTLYIQILSIISKPRHMFYVYV